jgi:hypothetical protein
MRARYPDGKPDVGTPDLNREEGRIFTFGSGT